MKGKHCKEKAQHASQLRSVSFFSKAELMRKHLFWRAFLKMTRRAKMPGKTYITDFLGVVLTFRFFLRSADPAHKTDFGSIDPKHCAHATLAIQPLFSVRLVPGIYIPCLHQASLSHERDFSGWVDGGEKHVRNFVTFTHEALQQIDSERQ